MSKKAELISRLTEAGLKLDEQTERGFVDKNLLENIAKWKEELRKTEAEIEALLNKVR